MNKLRQNVKDTTSKDQGPKRGEAIELLSFFIIRLSFITAQQLFFHLGSQFSQLWETGYRDYKVDWSCL